MHASGAVIKRTLKNSAERERSMERDICDCERERSGKPVKSAAGSPIRVDTTQIVSKRWS